MWDPPRGCSGPLEDAYRKRETVHEMNNERTV